MDVLLDRREGSYRAPPVLGLDRTVRQPTPRKAAAPPSTPTRWALASPGTTSGRPSCCDAVIAALVVSGVAPRRRLALVGRGPASRPRSSVLAVAFGRGYDRTTPRRRAGRVPVGAAGRPRLRGARRPRLASSRRPAAAARGRGDVGAPVGRRRGRSATRPRRSLHRRRSRGVAMSRTLVVGDAASVAARHPRPARCDAPRLPGRSACACRRSTDRRAAGRRPGARRHRRHPAGRRRPRGRRRHRHRLDARGDALRRLSWALGRAGAHLVVAPGPRRGARARGCTVRPTAGLSLLEVEIDAPRRRLLAKSALDRTLGACPAAVDPGHRRGRPGGAR